jgi:UDP-N-acetylglucosamine acyltransferase
VTVHPLAFVDPRARVGEGSTVGPFAFVGASVSIGRNCKVHAHACLDGSLSAGDGNEFFPGAVLGTVSQERRNDGASGHVRIGHRNVFREQVTVHGGSFGGTTEVGDDNWLLVGSHVAHDVRLGSHCVLSNGTQLAGHVVVEDFVTFGGLSAVAQRVRINESAFVAGGSMVERDVPPFVIVQGDRARVRAINRVGLERRGASRERIRVLRAVLRAHLVLRSAEVVRERAAQWPDDPWVAALARALAP